MNIAKEHISEILEIIEKAGALLLEIYKKQDLEIQLKSDASPVTEADKQSNQLLRNELNHLFPDIPILSEESDIPDYSVRQKWKLFWMVDPLDGTKEFIYKNGRFCINIALIEDNIPIFGIINNICDHEIIWAFRDDTCYLKKGGITTELKAESPIGSKLKMAVSRFNITEAEFNYIDYLQDKGLIIELVPLGASSKQCEIAKGTIDLSPKFGQCYEWDTAAGQVIIETGGGMIVNSKTSKNLEYNKKDIKNPPFIMLSKKIKEQIEAGNDVFLKAFSEANN